MDAKKRLLTALHGGTPDRLPATTHHVMPYFLDRYLNGMSAQGFFDHFGLDPIKWINPRRANESNGEWLDAEGCLQTGEWRIESEPLDHPDYVTVRYRIITPRGTLTTVTQSNAHTTWATEPLIKEKSDVDLIGAYAPAPTCDVEAVNEEAAAYGGRGLIRGHICTFEIHGQPGCWQDAACLYGIEPLILATYDDPQWVHALLRTLQTIKKAYVGSLSGARYDLLELGGGDASSTVISPRLFDRFVAPYDAELIDLAHASGQRIAYHTCGGMMPLLERIADMAPDAMETFTPVAMGGDVDLAEAKARIGDRVCMIGGWDQFHFFRGCSPEQTRAEVRRCFEAAGAGGGFILSPSDHFFDADPELIAAYADEARRCTY